MTTFHEKSQLEAMAEEFNRLGYLRVEHALSAEQIARFNLAVDAHYRNFPDDWISLSDLFCEGTNLLPHTADFDEVIENRKTLEILLRDTG